MTFEGNNTWRVTSRARLHPSRTDVPFQITHSKSFPFRQSGGPFTETSTLTPAVSHSAVYLSACVRVDVAGRYVQGVLEITHDTPEINTGHLARGSFRYD